MKRLILLLAFVASPALAQEEGPFPQTCSYSDTREPDEDAAFEVDCTMRYVFTPSGVRYTFRFGGRAVVVDVSGEAGNGLWRSIRLNGSPGARLELWRGSYVAVTNDLSVSFEWRDRNEPKYPAE